MALLHSLYGIGNHCCNVLVSSLDDAAWRNCNGNSPGTAHGAPNRTHGIGCAVYHRSDLTAHRTIAIAFANGTCSVRALQAKTRPYPHRSKRRTAAGAVFVTRPPIPCSATPCPNLMSLSSFCLRRITPPSPVNNVALVTTVLPDTLLLARQGE